MTTPDFFSLTASTAWPGVWPGALRMRTLPSPNTSWSPSISRVVAVLTALHALGSTPKGVGVAGVVEVEVREREVGHVGGRHTDGLQLVDQRRLDAQLERAYASAVLVLGQLVAEAGVPEQRAHRVADQVAGDGERAGLAIVFAGVGEDPHVQHVHMPALDGVEADRADGAFGPGGSGGDGKQQRGCEDEKASLPGHRTFPAGGERRSLLQQMTRVQRGFTQRSEMARVVRPMRRPPTAGNACEPTRKMRVTASASLAAACRD